MNAEQAGELYDYTQWAHRRVWTCIETLSDEQFTRDLAYSWGSIRNQFVHMLDAEMAWLSRLSGSPMPDELAVEDFPTREAVVGAWREVEAGWRAYLDDITDAELEAIVTYTRSSGAVKHDRRWQIITHVVNHGTDHRAQILAMLHQLGAPTVEQDFPIYVWERAGT